MFNASAAGRISDIKEQEKGGFAVSIDTGSETVIDQIPAGLDILVKIGQTVGTDTALTNNPNVGGFGQEESEIVLQSSARVLGYLAFCFALLLTQILLILKKKQYEKVQAAELNF